MVDRRKRARIRNWNKRVLICAIYSLKTIIAPSKAIGLTIKEKEEVEQIISNIANLIASWKKAL